MNNNNISPAGNGASATKKKRKFNVIDFFILLLIVALIAALIYAFSPWSHIKKLWTTNETHLQYVVELQNVDTQFVQMIEDCDDNGVMVINSVTKNDLGRVSRVDDPQERYELHYKIEEGDVEAANPTPVPVKIKDKYDITVYITATAQYEPGVGYTVNGCRIAVGEQIPLRFPNFSQNGHCIDVVTDS